MADDSFAADTDVNYEGVNFQQIATEELDKAAQRTENTWMENMLEEGYNNTSETVNSITWEETEEFVRRVGSDKIAALIGEYGRRPGAGHPPPDALGQWVHEQAGLPNRGETVEWSFDKWSAEDQGPQELTFDDVVFIIGRSINDRGLPAHAFGRRAFAEESPKYEDSVAERLQQKVDDQSV